ncbi:MaoC family dehydratase [Nocardioides endophyticus]|uniref:MaoC family dehydratase n=1 Tax=Nocardioides endophyticus TaxID=1353775 RepID=A0ABP8ZDC4_9ACTN
MRTFTGIDDVEASVGQHLGYTDWLEVTQADINLFADATHDHQWIHVDPERAKDGPYGATIAHGYWTLSLVPSFLYQLYAIEGLRMQVNYGSDRVRYPAPVRCGTRIRAGAEFTAFTRGSSHAQLTTTIIVEVEGETKPACVAEVLTRLA